MHRIYLLLLKLPAIRFSFQLLSRFGLLCSLFLLPCVRYSSQRPGLVLLSIPLFLNHCCQHHTLLLSLTIHKWLLLEMMRVKLCGSASRDAETAPLAASLLDDWMNHLWDFLNKCPLAWGRASLVYSQIPLYLNMKYSAKSQLDCQLCNWL